MGVKDISIYNFHSLLLLGCCNLHATACAVNSTELKKVNAEHIATHVQQSLKV